MFLAKMVLKTNEYKIENDGIWISKKALERNRDAFAHIANEYNEKSKERASIYKSFYRHYLGKKDAISEILKMFDKEIFD